MIIGVISDTHGLLRPQALEALQGSQLILHAGDIGRPEILVALGEISPVIAVRGNNDIEEWARAIPETAVVPIADRSLYMLHDLHELDLDVAATGFLAVVSGHTHRPKLERKQGALYFNPGSAGPRRFKLPVSVGRLIFFEGKLDGEILKLSV